MGTESDSGNPNGWNRARGLVMKTLILIGGAILVKRLTKSTTRRDHARFVAESLTGEKVVHQHFMHILLLLLVVISMELLLLT